MGTTRLRQPNSRPHVRLESIGSSQVTIAGLQFLDDAWQRERSCTVAIHRTSFLPLVNLCLRVVANGIATATCHSVTVTAKQYKEFKVEVKEKLEIIETIDVKRIRDVLERKRVLEIDDPKLIREDFDFNIFERIEEEWVQTVRTLATHADLATDELGRTFIKEEERPLVGPPPPEIEEIKPRIISEEEARRTQEKHVFRDKKGKVIVNQEAEELHELTAFAVPVGWERSTPSMQQPTKRYVEALAKDRKDKDNEEGQ